MEKFIFIITLVILGGCGTSNRLASPIINEDGSTPDEVVTGDAFNTSDGEVSEAAVNKDVEVVEADQDAEPKDAGQDSSSTDSQVSDADVKDGSQNVDSSVQDSSSLDANQDSSSTDAGQDSTTPDANQDAGQDAAPVCVPTCSGLVPQTCNANGNLVNGSPCPYLCAVGSCIGICTPNDTQCSGLNSQTCNAAGQWVTSQTCPYTCSGAGVCSGSCETNATRCDGNNSKTCNSSGQWETTETCLYVCSGAGICSGSCVPQTTQCSGNYNNTPQTCDATGNWVSGTTCPYACINGSCYGSCFYGATRCSGNDSQTCGYDMQWHTDHTCPYVCKNGGTCSGSCVPGSKQCNGNTTQTCDSTGTWQNVSTCQFMCSSGSCTGVCVPGNTMCSGTQIQTCNASGQWNTASNCAAVAGATSYCSNGACEFNCNLDYDDCDGLPGNGCEVNLNTDKDNCGQCEHSCCGGTCENGNCGMYDTGINPDNTAYDVDSNNIYWSTSTELNQRPRTGGSTTVLETNQPTIKGVTVSGSNVIWSCVGTNQINGGIFSEPVGGGTMTTYTTEGDKDYITATANDIFYTRADKASVEYVSRTSNSTGVLLGNTLPDGTPANLTYAIPFVSDGTYLYTSYSSYPTGQKPIVKVPVHGGQITTFATPTTPGYYPNGLSIDSINLYYVLITINGSTTTMTVQKQPLAGGPASSLTPSNSQLGISTATDGTNVYYSTNKAILKVSTSGNTPITIATLSSTTTIKNIKVSNQCVYWYNSSTSTIQAVAVNP